MIQLKRQRRQQEVYETAEEVNEADQDENNVDKEAQLLPRIDSRKH